MSNKQVPLTSVLLCANFALSQDEKPNTQANENKSSLQLFPRCSDL